MADSVSPDATYGKDEPVVVYKLGGSLLELPDLRERISDVLSLRQPARQLLVVGGGAAANVVRAWDRQHRLGDDMAHELALLAMGLNEEFLERLLPRARLVRSARQFDLATTDGVLPILCSHCFLKWGEAAGHPPLPHSWEVTSDSIAAWVARILHANELVLMKSVSCPRGTPVDEATRQGLVDSCFAEIAAKVPVVSWCAPREGVPTITPWLRAGRVD